MADSKSDTIRIRHMADAARKAVQFTQSKSRTDLDTDLPILIQQLEDVLQNIDQRNQQNMF